MARNPLGGGHLRPSALSFVGDDRPDRRPPHSAPISHNCPPRDLRDFYHGLLGFPLQAVPVCARLSPKRVRQAILPESFPIKTTFARDRISPNSRRK